MLSLNSEKMHRKWLWVIAWAGGVVLVLILVTSLRGQAATQQAIESVPASSGDHTGRATLLDVDNRSLSLVDRLDGEHYPSCRFGVTMVGGDVGSYDVTSLNVGWYLNFATAINPQRPGGAEFFQMVRLSQVGNGFTFQPATSTLYAIIDANPGAMWLIGNEQDRRAWQDDLVPEIYARAYHHLYGLIKGRDPSAQIAIGGVVQPTPLRFQYLDIVWDTYLQEYGAPMPVDAWNVHTFILREISSDHPLAQQPGYEVWGADIPRGAQFDGVMAGILYPYSQQDDIAIFRERIIEFRRWMATKGQRDKPLLVTEYGVLFPEDYSDEKGQLFSSERVSAFMQATFDFFRSYTDASIGYPADGNRLVQRWAWYSVNGNPWSWGGTLFDPDSHAIRPLGEDFRAYTGAISPTIDLLTARAFAESGAVFYEGVPVTFTLKALVSNAGDISATEPFTVTFYDGPPGQGGSSVIGSPQVITSGLHGCADYTVVSVLWPGLDVGAYPFWVQVQGSDTDVSLANNVAQGVVLVATERVFLPLVMR